MTAADLGAVEPWQRVRRAAMRAFAAGAATPLLLLDLSVLRQQVALWRRCLPDVQPFYAVKANGIPAVVDRLRDEGLGFDAATGGELEQLHAQGVPGARMLCTHPIRDAADLRAVARVRPWALVVQDPEEVHKLAAAGVPCPGYAPTLLVRVALPFSNLDKFGARVLEPVVAPARATWRIDAAAVAAVFAAAQRVASGSGVRFGAFGLAGHVGTNCVEVEHFRVLLALFRYLREEMARSAVDLAVFDLGGGFCDRATAVAHGATQETVLAAIGAAVAEARQACPGVRLIAEPGRFFVADAASLVVTVKSVRRLPWRLSVASGHVPCDHLEVHIDDGIYGNLMGQEHDGRRWEFELLDQRSDAAALPAQIWGATCDTFDRIEGLRRLPADLAAGERLLLAGAGAYTVATSTRFNRTAPTQVFAFDGDSG